MNEQWQELKETIIEMRDNDGTLTQQEVCKFLANLMDVLEKQMSSSENPNKWIPVSERLPETDEDVLITNGVTMYIGWIDATDRQWRADSEDNYFINDVVAWMPLPQPYKVESEE